MRKQATAGDGKLNRAADRPRRLRRDGVTIYRDVHSWYMTPRKKKPVGGQKKPANARWLSTNQRVAREAGRKRTLLASARRAAKATADLRHIPRNIIARRCKRAIQAGERKLHAVRKLQRLHKISWAEIEKKFSTVYKSVVEDILLHKYIGFSDQVYGAKGHG